MGKILVGRVNVSIYMEGVHGYEHEVKASCGNRMGEANKKILRNVIKLNHI